MPLDPMSLFCLALAIVSTTIAVVLAVRWPRDGAAISRLEALVAERTEELAREKAFVERLIEHVPAGIAFMDRDYVVRRFNPAYEPLLRQEPASYLGRSLFDFAPQVRPHLEPILQHVVTACEPYHIPAYRFERVRGDERVDMCCEVTYVPIPGPQGEVEGVMTLVLDTTDRDKTARLQQAQLEQLQALDRYKDEFLSVISHELRTPLNFIMGFSSLLDDGVAGPLSAPQRHYIERIIAGAERMRGLVNDLLDYAQLRAGKLGLAPKPTAFAPLVDEVLVALEPLATARDLRLVADIAVDGPVELDHRRIVQVLTNLVSNAIKFSEQGTVTVRAFRLKGERLRVEVIDHGRGIAAEDQGRLFNRFEQLDMSRTRAAGGTGLGLAIVKDMVEAHGGAVGVESEPGRGATFWFEVPTAMALVA